MKKEIKKREKHPADDKVERKGEKMGENRAEADVFDPGRIEKLVGLMKSNDLTELDLSQGRLRIQLRRGPLTGAPNVVSAPAVAPIPMVATPASAPPVAAVPVAEGNDSPIKEFKSPMVGTFYAASSPTAAPFVRVGDIITPAKTLCIIEAMKVFNEIPAEMSGKIVAVLAKSGEEIEFGRPLFKIDTRG